jgi:hypothetical protein
MGPFGTTGRKWTSTRPNAHHAWDCLDDSFLNAEGHQEALDVLDAWKFAPWKGAIYRGLIFIEETTYSGHWEPLSEQPVVRVPEPLAAPSAPYSGPMMTVGMTKDGINRAYESYLIDPERELPALQIAVASYVQNRKGRCFMQASSLLVGIGAEFHLEAMDIINDFTLDVLRRFGNGQYTREHPFHTWIGFIWKRYFFPKVQSTVLTYMKRNTFMNPLNPDDDSDYEPENRSVLMFSVELEMAKREAEGYKVPITADRVLRELDDSASPLYSLSTTTKTMLRAMATGATKEEAAAFAGVSERHARRLLEAVPLVCGRAEVAQLILAL